MESPQPPASPVTVDVKVFTPEQLTKLLLFCKEHEIAATPTSAAFFTPTMFDPTLRTPTPTFKAICGPEWLNSKGKLQAASVYAFLQNYVRVHRLEQPDGTITLSNELREALQATSHSIFKHQLLSLVPSAFQPGS